MELQENEDKRGICTRLRRIEGQVKGIENMIDNGACCRDILIQIAAIRAAINKVGGLVLENYAKECIICGDSKLTEEEKIEQLVSTLTMFIK